MALKALLLTKLAFLIVCVFTFGCTEHPKQFLVKHPQKVDVSQVPNITVLENNDNLKLLNGVYYFGNKPYSGYIHNNYYSDKIKLIASYLKGKQHGITKTFFANGKLETERNYKDGLSYGRHLGYWENGNIKFDFMYLDDKREGKHKQWYESGMHYFELTFADDKEFGMQKAWRENGKLFMNYEVKNGLRYGLQKAGLCYTLKNEKLK
jgi:hypothetical protein